MENRNQIFPQLGSFIKSLKNSNISDSRKELLQKLISYIRQQKEKGERAKLNFICTHNSRRSQLAQVWATVFSEIYKIPTEVYSGGTEITSFHPNAIQALERAGFIIKKTDSKKPEVLVYFSQERRPIVCFSKLYDDEVNPTNNFAAVMTCSEADKNCPFIQGASERIPLNYNDPKEFDKTPEEKEKYDECNRQIALEMKFIFSQIKND